MARGLVAGGIGTAVLLGFLYYQGIPFFNKLISLDPAHSLMLKFLEVLIFSAPTVLLPVWVIRSAYRQEERFTAEEPKELQPFGFGFGMLKSHANWLVTEATKQGAVDLVRKDETMKEESLMLEGKIVGTFLPVDVNGVPYVHIGTGKPFKVELTDEEAKKEEKTLGQLA